MNRFTRRRFVAAGGAAMAAGAAGLGGALWRQSAFAAMDAGHKTALVSAAPAAPAGSFTNRLRLPGASGLYTAAAAKDVKQITVGELNFEVLPKLSSPFWAYVAEVGGKQLLNPTLLARPGDQVELRMLNRLKQPTIIHWHGMTNDERNDGAGMYQVDPAKASTMPSRCATALDFSHSFSGDQTYMFHCHNLEHEDTGMMIGYQVKA